jgi:hypothetical protein
MGCKRKEGRERSKQTKENEGSIQKSKRKNGTNERGIEERYAIFL